jgi:hypothetical protein
MPQAARDLAAAAWHLGFRSAHPHARFAGVMRAKEHLR